MGRELDRRGQNDCRLLKRVRQQSQSVQLNCAAKDFTIEGQGQTSCPGEFDVGRRVRHGSNLSHRSTQPLEGRIDPLDPSPWISDPGVTHGPDPCDPQLGASADRLSADDGVPHSDVPVAMACHTKLGYKTSAAEHFLAAFLWRRTAAEVLGNGAIEFGAHARIRTGDLFLTKDVLYPETRPRDQHHHFPNRIVRRAPFTFRTS